jgi:hypothetical protein
MAITINVEESRSISAEEYIDYVERNVDPEDDESIIASAGMLKALKTTARF